MVLEHIQNLGGTAVFIPSVKGQVQHRLPRVPQVGGVILGQSLLGGAAHRRLPLGLEAEPPGAGLHRPGGQRVEQQHHSQGHGAKANHRIPFSHKNHPGQAYAA